MHPGRRLRGGPNLILNQEFLRNIRSTGDSTSTCVRHVHSENGLMSSCTMLNARPGQADGTVRAVVMH